MGKAKINFIYNSFYQIFSIIVPIILAPYLSRRLGVDGTGVYSYTYSIAYYFMLFAMLGINNYGSRTIAKCRNNKVEMSRKFCEIYSIQLLLGIIALTFYGVFLCNFAAEYQTISIIQGMFVVSAVLDVNWFFYGLEDFKVTVTRSFIIRAINFVLVLVLVKDASDLWVYTLVMSATAFLNQVVLWPFVLKKVSFSMPKISQVKKHLKPLCVLFVPVIAVSLYKIMDKIMLGAMSDIDEVGLYEYAEKINSIPLVIISALGTVMLPKISSIVQDRKKVKIYLVKALKFVLFLTVPIFFVLLLTAPTIVPFYLGESFSGVSVLAILLSFSLPFVSVANVMRTQYLIPMEKDKIYTYSVLVGAGLNLLVNFILIPFIGALGACIGTIISEISVMIFQTLYIHRNMKVGRMFISWVRLLAKSVSIFIVCLPLSFLEINKYLLIIAQFLIFIALYAYLNRKYILKLIRKEEKYVQDISKSSN